MLICKDYAIKGKGKDAIATEYKRVYLQYGPKDEIVLANKTSDGEILKKDVEVPKADVSVHDERELLAEGLKWISENVFDKDKDGNPVPVSAVMTLLNFGSNGLDLSRRQEARPVTVDLAAVIESTAKRLLKAKMFPDLATAIAAVRAMAAAKPATETEETPTA